MKKYIGGYSILDLASPTIYADALGALKQDKPVLVYDEPECYYADTIKATTIDGDDVIQITKGGKTITIANDSTITNVGDIQNHLYEIGIEFELKNDNNVALGVIIGKIKTTKNTITKDDLKQFISYNFYGLTFNSNSDDDNPIRICKEMRFGEGDCYIVMSDFNAFTDTTDVEFNLTNSVLTQYYVTKIF